MSVVPGITSVIVGRDISRDRVQVGAPRLLARATRVGGDPATRSTRGCVLRQTGAGSVHLATTDHVARDRVMMDRAMRGAARKSSSGGANAPPAVDALAPLGPGGVLAL